jgi:hypothetical protein
MQRQPAIHPSDSLPDRLPDAVGTAPCGRSRRRLRTPEGPARAGARGWLPGSTVAALVVAGILASVVPAGAATTLSITTLTDAPQAYVGQEVTVSGTVTAQTVGFRGESLYTLDQDGRRVTVLSAADAPAIGSVLEVTGRVALRPPDEEFTIPPVVVESARRILP